MATIIIKVKSPLFTAKEFRRAINNHLKGLNPPRKPNQSHEKAT